MPAPAKRSTVVSVSQRDLDRRAKREAVLREAVRLFNERGFAATSLDDVAARLNVTKPIIYRHFANKDQILFECVRMGLEQILEAADGAAKESGDAATRLSALLRRYALIMTQDFGMCIVRTGDHELSDASRKEFRALKRKIDLVIRNMIKAGMKDGSIPNGDARLLSFAIAGAINSISRWFDAKGSQSADKIAEIYADYCMRALHPSPKKPLQR
ncbi:MAG: TetR/AcrR family transcriptional regulator [Caulobacterales bacterium]